MQVKRKLTPKLLYLGIALFIILVAITAYAIDRDWRARIDDARARAIFDLVSGTIPNRPTDTPGASAWLHRELIRYLARAGDGDIAAWQDYRTLPGTFKEYGNLLAMPPAGEKPEGPATLLEINDPDGTEGERLHFREQFYAALGQYHFVVTRRRALGSKNLTETTPSNRFLQATLPRLAGIAERLPESRGQAPDHRVVRLYALCEDSMLATLPLGEPAMATLLHEGAELRKMPKLPNFVSNEFFFVFDFSNQHRQPFFSGLYLDVGGQGLVATLTAPYHAPEGQLEGVLGMDIAFDLDWQDLAANLEAPLHAELVQLPRGAGTESGGWQPWRALLEAGPRGDPRLQAALQQLNQKQARLFHNPSPIYHGVVDDVGAVVSFRVDPTSWLVVLFPETRSGLPLLPLLFLVILLLLLLTGFEWNRRRAERAQKKAVREFEEKQNLLETMRVPLMVIDPNTEQVVYGNRAARELGIEQGGNFTDLIGDDRRVREHYERMQVAQKQDRRAYGLPLEIGDGTAYAVIRSVAVRAPIEMIHADERHRLGILFIIDPEADLSLYTEKLIGDTRHGERHKLAGLLSHGVDTLAKVLHHQLERQGHSPFTQWLSGYILRRIHVTGWVLENWQAPQPPEANCLIDVAAAVATLNKLEAVFQAVRDDADLRTRLHWNNGILAAKTSGKTLVQRHIDWPENYSTSCPVKGGFGLFWGEVLINAVRHGQPGSRPSLQIVLDPLRRELNCLVSNVPRVDSANEELKPYGGRAILERLAFLFHWRDLKFGFEPGLFSVSWRIPVCEREIKVQGD